MASSASSPKQKRLDHALHNEQACDVLHAEGGYPDWVITTAFYAAVHFVEHKLFPLYVTRDGAKTKVSTLKEYYGTLNRSRRAGMHTERQRLVEQRHTAIAAKFKRLRDLSQNARYLEYAVNGAYAGRARALMADVKAYCTG